MRHRNKTNSLGRKTQHRKAMLANMACSLIEHKRITTTVAKAKALKRYVEPLITKSKDDTTHSRRTVFGYLQNKEAVSELFREVAPKIGDRPGGYTRIIKLGYRQGDAADMCLIELVDYNDLYVTESKDSGKKTRRSRRGGGGGKKKSTAEAKQTAPKKEKPKAEEKVEEKKAEVKAVEPKGEAKDQKTEAKPENKEEAKKEEPKAEAKEEKKPETKAEEKKDESSGSDEKKEGDNKSE